MTGLLLFLDGLVTRERVRRWVFAVLLCEAALGTVLVLGTQGLLVRLAHATTTDFISFYAAGRIADGADPSLVYDRAVHYATEQALTAPGISYVHFFYPPVFLLVCGVLALLPKLVAFTLFQTGTVALCVGVVAWIAGGRWRDTLPVILGFAPLLWSVDLGQNACLTAAVFGAGTLLLQRERSIAAGLVLSCLLFKPHTGLLIPVALAASGDKRALLACACGAAGWTGLSAWVFGTASWVEFLHVLARAQGSFATGQVIPLRAMASSFGAARQLGLSLAGAYVFELLVTAGALWAVASVWARTRGAARHGVLVASALIAMPVVLFYDLTSLLVAGAWLYRASREDGALAGERSVLALAWLAGLLTHPITTSVPFPFAFAACVSVFWLSLRRSLRVGDEKLAASRSPGSLLGPAYGFGLWTIVKRLHPLRGAGFPAGDK